MVETASSYHAGSHRENYSLIEIFAHQESWIKTGHSAIQAPMVVLDCPREKNQDKEKGWNDSKVTLRGGKLTNSTLTHHTTSLVNFTPDKFNLKWKIDSLKHRNEGHQKVSSNSPARVMYVQNCTCKYLLNWELKKSCPKNEGPLSLHVQLN